MTTVAFLSLFFGLITGPYPIELTVSGPAASVEIVVDGRSAGTLPGAPWKGTINFGSSLLPHQIVARALDAQGHELGRAEEWVNLAHPLSKAEIVLEGGGKGPPKAARVAWTNLKGEQPHAVSLTFDGLPVPLDANRRGVLPAHDLGSIHLLTAQVDFTPLESVRRDLAYGGEYGSEVATELTGVPVRARSGEVPPAAKLGGWLFAAGKPLTVAAVENGPGKLYVVRVPTPQEVAEKMGRVGHLARDIRYEMQLGKEDGVRFVFPVPKRIEGSGDQLSDLFDISPVSDYRTGSLPWLLRTLRPEKPGAWRTDRFIETPPLTGPLRIADAVAVAGLQAAAENRRRAVLLVLSGDERDASTYDPTRVRRYLAALRVPLVVWTLDKPEPGSLAEAWGPSENISQSQALYKAAAELRDLLGSQRIVMVDGRFLPQSIALSPQASGLELVGSVP
ncbi:MAG TPA: hypothetical protein VGM86_23845 [Thermoanaerobaculia bacterium]|jgi:hypothetical protein